MLYLITDPAEPEPFFANEQRAAQLKAIWGDQFARIAEELPVASPEEALSSHHAFSPPTDQTGGVPSPW